MLPTLPWHDFQGVFFQIRKEGINRISTRRLLAGKKVKGKNGNILNKEDVVFDNPDILAQIMKPSKTEENSALKLQHSLYDAQKINTMP